MCIPHASYFFEPLTHGRSDLLDPLVVAEFMALDGLVLNGLQVRNYTISKFSCHASILHIYVNICAIHMYIIHTYIHKDMYRCKYAVYRLYIRIYIYIDTHMLCICKYPKQFEFTITIHINLMNHVPTAWYMYLSQSCISPFTNISRVTFAKSKHNPVQWIQTQKYMTQCTCVYLCVYIHILMHLFYVYTCIYKYMCVLFIR